MWKWLAFCQTHLLEMPAQQNSHQAWSEERNFMVTPSPDENHFQVTGIVISTCLEIYLMNRQQTFICGLIHVRECISETSRHRVDGRNLWVFFYMINGGGWNLYLFFFFYLLAHFHAAKFCWLSFGINHNIKHGAYWLWDSEICWSTGFCSSFGQSCGSIKTK